MMIPAVWWSPGAGRQAKRGSSDRATFMRKVPEPERYRCIRSRKSAGNTAASSSFRKVSCGCRLDTTALARIRSEEHTSELQSRQYIVCRLLLEKKLNSSHANISYAVF